MEREFHLPEDKIVEVQAHSALNALVQAHNHLMLGCERHFGDDYLETEPYVTIDRLIRGILETTEIPDAFIQAVTHASALPETARAAIAAAFPQGPPTDPEAAEHLAFCVEILRVAMIRTRDLAERFRHGDAAREIPCTQIESDLRTILGTASRASTSGRRMVFHPGNHGPSSHLIVFSLHPLPHHNGFMLPPSFKEVMLDLVLNSRKYSPTGTTISLEVSESPEGIVITVTDEGIGIPEEDAERVVEPGVRGGNSNRTDGFGLGLTKAYWLTKLAGGTFTIDSGPVGGTRITISLPSFR